MIIVNGLVHDAVNPEPRKIDIRIENGKIAELLPSPSGFAGERFDAAGMQIFPGLIDAHSHIGLDGYAVGYPGSDYNELNEILTPELDAVDAVNPFDPAFQLALSGGVTCVATGPGSSNVLGGTFTAIKTSGIRVDDMIVKHKVAMKCAFGENPKECYKNKSDSSRMTTAAKLRGVLARASEYLRKKEAAGNDSSKYPDFDFRLEALLPVLRGELPLKAHAHQANDIFTAIRIAKEFNLRLTLEHCTEGHLIAGILAREGYPLAVGPSLSFATKPELKNQTFATPGILAKAGCKVSIITDCGVIPQEYLGLLAGLAVRSGMDPFDALRAITIRPAEHLGIDRRVGSIQTGKDADLVLCDGSILDSATRVRAVFIEGQQVL